MKNFLADPKILGNDLRSIFLFLGVLLLAVLLNRYLSKVIGRFIYGLFKRIQAEGRLEQFQALVLRPVGNFLLLLMLVAGLQLLKYPPSWKITVFNRDLQNLLYTLLKALLVISFTWILLRITDYIAIAAKVRALKTESKLDDQLVPFVKDVAKVLIIVFSLFTLLGSVFHFDITSLLAGLGIGGLAVAFAAQESIKDLFGSFTIFLDKPFTIGDVVKVGDTTGTVERVGFRSTRLRLDDQTFVTMPNKKMLDHNVENMTLRPRRRVLIRIGVPYETSTESLKKIISELREYFQNSKDLNQDYLVTLDDFGESALLIYCRYFVPFMIFEEHMARREEVNYAIMDIIYRNGSSFAFPVREIRISGKVENAE